MDHYINRIDIEQEMTTRCFHALRCQRSWKTRERDTLSEESFVAESLHRRHIADDDSLTSLRTYCCSRFIVLSVQYTVTNIDGVRNAFLMLVLKYQLSAMGTRLDWYMAKGERDRKFTSKISIDGWSLWKTYRFFLTIFINTIITHLRCE